VILFAAAGFVLGHYLAQDWTAPAGILVGLLVAPMVPVGPKDREE
jgi:hypothetical protein